MFEFVFEFVNENNSGDDIDKFSLGYVVKVKDEVEALSMFTEFVNQIKLAHEDLVLQYMRMCIKKEFKNFEGTIYLY